MESISKLRGHGDQYGQVARCRSGRSATKPVCPAGNVADGFLATQFLPVYASSDQPQNYNESAEQDYFKSCSILASATGIELMDVANHPFPVNILLSYWSIYHQLSRWETSLDLEIIELDDQTTSLVSTQKIETYYTAYHIPVQPLFQLLKNKEQNATAQLLLSVFAY